MEGDFRNGMDLGMAPYECGSALLVTSYLSSACGVPALSAGLQLGTAASKIPPTAASYLFCESILTWGDANCWCA